MGGVNEPSLQRLMDLFQIPINVGGNCFGLAGHREGGERRFGIVRGQRLDRSHALRQGLRDLGCMPRHPDAGAIDATATAVDEDAIHHDVQVLLPVIHLVIAEKDLAEPWSVSLYAGIALVLFDRGAAAENQTAGTTCQYRGAHVAEAGIDGDGLFGYARLHERLGHPVGRPGLLRAGLQHQADLHRNDRQPQGMHARRIARQDHAEHGRLRLVANRHAALLNAEAARQNGQIQSPRERV